MPFPSPGFLIVVVFNTFPGGSVVKTLKCGRCRRHGFDPWVRKIPWRRACNPPPCFYLKNPMDRGAWRAIVHRVTKSRTQLKQLSTHALMMACRLLSLVVNFSSPKLNVCVEGSLLFLLVCVIVRNSVYKYFQMTPCVLMLGMWH